MKRLLAILLAAVTAAALAACGAAQTAPTPPPNQSQSDGGEGNVSPVLIAFYDAGQRQDVRRAAVQIQQAVGGHLLAIGENGASGADAQMRACTHLLLGFSPEQGALPAAVRDFLTDYDFGAKMVLPFLVGPGADANEMIAQISALQPGALVEQDALIVADGTAIEEQTIARWLQAAGLLQQPAQPQAGAGNTVATATVTPHQSQTLYLWEEGNAPATTTYTVNNGNYSDDPDFRPYLTSFPVPQRTQIKGAVLICLGGAFQFRSREPEGVAVAQALSARGYQSFVLDYRLRPYTQQEGALDLARAVRFVRAHAAEYGIAPEDIAVMGFSAGGILAGEMLLHFDGLVNGTALDADYVPDALDAVSADAAADGMIYAFYGRLSVGSTDVEALRAGNLPPTFYCYGTRDPFYRQFLANADAVEAAGALVQRLQLTDMPHGFGSRGGWIDPFDQWLTGVFADNA